ncbi:MAG: FMN-binding protein [Longimicrobiales bacterium]
MSERLPVVGREGAYAPVEVDPSAARLVGTLAVAGAVAGLAIVLVFQWAQPRIEAHQAAVLAEAITEVLGGPEEYHTFFLEDGALTRAPAADTAGLDRVWVGYDGVGRPVGVAVQGAEPGFQDVIRLLFGYHPGTDEVLGMTVLESKETPGLGDKIEKDSAFVAGFARVAAPLVGVKADRATGADDEVVMITGATISSRAIVDIINHRLEALGGPLGTLWTSASLAPGGAAASSPPGGAP